MRIRIQIIVCIHLRHTWDASRVAEPELGFLVWSLLTHEANEETISSQGLAPEPKDFKKLGSHPKKVRLRDTGGSS